MQDSSAGKYFFNEKTAVSSYFSLLSVRLLWLLGTLFLGKTGLAKGGWYEGNLFLPFLTQSGSTFWP